MIHVYRHYTFNVHHYMNTVFFVVYICWSSTLKVSQYKCYLFVAMLRHYQIVTHAENSNNKHFLFLKEIRFPYLFDPQKEDKIFCSLHKIITDAIAGTRIGQC